MSRCGSVPRANRPAPVVGRHVPLRADGLDRMTAEQVWKAGLAGAKRATVTLEPEPGGLRVVLIGDPSGGGPVTVEVRDPGGRLLRRFEPQRRTVSPPE